MSSDSSNLDGIEHALAALSAETIVLEAVLLCVIDETKVDRNRLLASFEQHMASIESRYVNADIPEVHVDLLHQAIEKAKKNIAEF